MKVTKDNGSSSLAVKIESQDLLVELIELFRNRLPTDHSGIDSVELTLDRAMSSAEVGLTHDALIHLAKASLLVSQSPFSSSWIRYLLLAVAVLISAAILLLAWTHAERFKGFPSKRKKHCRAVKDNGFCPLHAVYRRVRS